MKANENQIIVVDEDGVEYAMEILFTYENDERCAKYVLVYDHDAPDDIYAFKYDDEHNLTEVTDDEELDEVEEVLNAYQDEFQNEI
ncbi:MAG: DUF1292 domain-containing protein [Erysipelotrichales bacterium]|nr:DUF1292 domain-containing protein [Erysipelotrichales bacterium]